MSELELEGQRHTRIRIVGEPNDARGFNVHVYDADTGESIDNINKIVLTLEPTGINYAEVTYYPKTDSNLYRGPITDKVVMAHTTFQRSEIDLTAYVSNNE